MPQVFYSTSPSIYSFKSFEILTRSEARSKRRIQQAKDEIMKSAGNAIIRDLAAHGGRLMIDVSNSIDTNKTTGEVTVCVTVNVDLGSKRYVDINAMFPTERNSRKAVKNG